jgi:glycerophosphoryl diester phosphodiesterase
MPGLDWLIARPVAHRGLHDAAAGVIENTPQAFSAAVAGHYAIECDVQLSSDGEAMVFHDSTLDRLTVAQGALNARTSDELKRIDFKSTSDRMITLSELCALAAGRVTLVVELKSGFNRDTRLVSRVVEVLKDYTGPVAVMSFDPVLISATRKLAPGLRRGLVAENRSEADPGPGGISGYLRDALDARPQFLAWSVADLPSAVPLAGRFVLGLPLLTWTVRTQS